ncbi:MAG TPA: DUF4129 domain-containing protein [Actinomycetota bacterium]
MNPRSAVRPALWAALAEGGLVYLPVKLLLEQATLARAGPLEWFPPFLALFVAGTVLVTRFRQSSLTPTVAAIGGSLVGLLQGALWGVRGPGEVGAAITASALVTLRVVTLGLRDWRNPVHASFGWGAGILLLEAVFGGTIGTTWRSALPFVVALFFVGSLVSRAESVRLTAPPEARLASSDDQAGEAVRTIGRRLSLVAVGALAASVALMGILTAGGGLDLMGRLLYPVLVFVVSAVAWIMEQIARPLFWLIEKLGLHPEGIVHFLHRLATGRTRALPNQPSPAGGGVIPRLLGLAFVVSIVGGLIWAIRRRRAEDDWGTERPNEPPVLARPLARPARIRLPRPPRRELPADTVRRWYAEALLLLERKGLARPAGATPDEFLQEVSAAFPPCRHGFHEMTRAYERVRYGAMPLGAEDVKRLEPRRAHVVEVLQRAKPLEREEEARA